MSNKSNCCEEVSCNLVSSSSSSSSSNLSTIDINCVTDTDILSSECVSSDLSRILKNSFKNKPQSQTCSENKTTHCDSDSYKSNSSECNNDRIKEDMCKVLKMIKCMNNEIKCLKKQGDGCETSSAAPSSRNSCNTSSTALSSKNSCDNPCDTNIKNYIDRQINCKFDQVMGILDNRLDELHKEIDCLKKQLISSTKNCC